MNKITKARSCDENEDNLVTDRDDLDLSQPVQNSQDSEAVELVEDGEIIQMEINDGAAAAQEFSSGNEDSDSDGEYLKDSQAQSNCGIEDQDSGEIEEYTTAGYRSKQLRQAESGDYCFSNGRKSVEEKLDNLNSMLEVMKDFFLKGGFVSQNDHSGKEKTTTKCKVKEKRQQGKDLITESNSEVTIYHNVLDRIQDTGDPEITFKPRSEGREIPLETQKKRDSSSSDEPIDTSDEMMDVDINENFIADCEKEAGRGRDELMDDNRSRDRENVHKQTGDIIKEAEASRARIFQTPGNSPQNLVIQSPQKNYCDNQVNAHD